MKQLFAKTVIYLLAAFLFPMGITQAQQTNVWRFGNKAGLDFNTNPPTVLPASNMYAFESCATMCDNQGQLLFYTNGTTVYNKNNVVMPNGSGLIAGPSATQCLIVPKPGDCTKYYIFHTGDHQTPNVGYYSMVDMCLNNGLGDVIPGMKNILLSNNCSEKFTAVKHANGTDVWVITHELSSAVFHSFLVTSSGVSSPVNTTIGSVHGSNCMIGYMIASHSGQKIVLDNPFCSVFDMFDFNSATGQLSNYVNLASQVGTDWYYGLEFSANDQLLYTTVFFVTGKVLQIDLNNNYAVTALCPTVSGNYKFGGMHLAPDGKIYISRPSQTNLAVINNPGVVGTGCGYSSPGITLAGGTNAELGLINFVPFLVTGQAAPIISLGSDTAIGCSNTITFTPSAACNSTYLWQDGSSASSYTAPGPGTYWVQVSNVCGIDRDTIVVQSNGSSGAPNANFLAANGWCGFTVTFGNMSLGATSYSWDFGDSFTSTASYPSHTYNGSGSYTVTLIASNPCGADTSTHVVNIQVQPVTAAFANVATVCSGNATAFANSSTGATTYQWDFGDSNSSTLATPSHSYTNAGTYTVTLIASNACLADTTMQVITVNQSPVAGIIGVDTICAGQAVMLSATGGTSVQWSGGSTSTQNSIMVSPPVTTTYYAVVSDSLCSSQPDTFTVYVIPPSVAVIAGPQSICVGQSATLTASGGNTYQWSGGSSATTASINVSPTTTTTYYVMPNSGSCGAVPDTLTVTVLPVPVVNVGGNTSICSGQSTTLTATGGGSYQWSGGSTDTTASITVSPTVTTTYFVYASNGTCNSNFSTITVTVQPTPTVTIIGNTAICPGTSTTLTAMGATTYQWAGGITATGQTVTVTPTTTTNYFAIGYNGSGCADTAMVSITVYDPFTVAIEGTDTICTGQSSQLHCTGIGTYQWSPSTGLSSTNTAYVMASPTVTTTYTVIMTDVHGCIDSATFTLYVQPCTGIAEHDAAAEIQLFPNPGDGLLTVEWKQGGTATLEVYDARGRLVRSTTVTGTSTQLDLRDHEDGPYLLRILRDGSYSTKRFVISR